MYARGYKRLFWGMLFIIFDINLGSINIMPDFIGYIFIYSGLNVLVSQHKGYEKAKVPAVTLILLTLKDVVYNSNNNILSGQVYSLGLITIVSATVVTIIKLYLIYVLCETIYEICKERGLNELMESARGSCKFYSVISLLYMVYYPLSINLHLDLKIIIIFILVIIQIIASISVASLLNKCKVKLEI
ncbi:hypothetical protein LGL08_15615 [Clostridium estertheticum]|uniref:hypothetical protein n=1 Tax=Clostridium estertheticum TaxID=238834 RepID=UPI001CF50B4C|nr:hypothetical protein [Clostridium estertheticum]MCB2307466.1 hypothetical protein [Clostridium estertheticum]MCB2345723.1 hypothetical protein [Clostridium estertheticum]MCB2350955.1 hypothetical protein [Clostridium estertheticum]WAG44063.1 hypothetical protein LL127_10705 [Clostridium estertheticum]